MTNHTDMNIPNKRTEFKHCLNVAWTWQDEMSAEKMKSSVNTVSTFISCCASRTEHNEPLSIKADDEMGKKTEQLLLQPYNQSGCDACQRMTHIVINFGVQSLCIYNWFIQLKPIHCSSVMNVPYELYVLPFNFEWLLSILTVHQRNTVCFYLCSMMRVSQMNHVDHDAHANKHTHTVLFMHHFIFTNSFSIYTLDFCDNDFFWSHLNSCTPFMYLVTFLWHSKLPFRIFKNGLQLSVEAKWVWVGTKFTQKKKMVQFASETLTDDLNCETIDFSHFSLSIDFAFRTICTFCKIAYFIQRKNQQQLNHNQYMHVNLETMHKISSHNLLSMHIVITQTMRTRSFTL